MIVLGMGMMIKVIEEKPKIVKLLYACRRFHVTVPKEFVDFLAWREGMNLNVLCDVIPEFNGDCVVYYLGDPVSGGIYSR